MATRFGQQPVVGVLRETGRSVTGVARYIGEDADVFRRAVYGKCHPSDLMRKRLPEILDAPLTQLFTEDALRWPLKRAKRRTDD